MPTQHSVERPTLTSSTAIISSVNSLSMSLRQINVSDIHTKKQKGSTERKHRTERFPTTGETTRQKVASKRQEIVTESVDDRSRSDGFLMANKKWNFVLAPKCDQNHFPSVTHLSSSTSKGEDSSEPSLLGIMFKISESKLHERRTSWPSPKQVTESDKRRKPSAPRRLRVNSIRASAHADRNERKVKLRRAQTAQDASIQGRSLRTLHQITHVEAIAASELERKRQKWLESEEKRKEEERSCLQRKVDHFIAKVERDKRKHRFGKSKMPKVLTGIDIPEAE